MPVDLAELLRPAHTVLLTQECQNGVVGAQSSLPALAAAARDSGMLANAGRLAAAARAAGAGVLHAIAARRPDGRGASHNARLFAAVERAPVQQLLGTPAVEVVDEIGHAPSDLVSTRLAGLSPIAGTDADTLLRNLGTRTLVIVGVSANIAIPNAVFDAVNLGYQVVLPRDAICGVPADYADVLIANTLSLVATITTTAEILGIWQP
ncbi:isochorismatase [Frankia sp. CcI49]|uniref:isochorismatase family protein n=1 Tax=unclassified Frankia TaxID=2632575 RepID=UPI0006CA4143|nr:MULTISPECIES: isochorismatase family protein [unclassified Frankia]KPM54129.1 isochorismatase [Frankia sp. R43]ONH61559.1 isochorismatase [Frankia sp. CcI49]